MSLHAHAGDHVGMDITAPTTAKQVTPHTHADGDVGPHAHPGYPHHVHTTLTQHDSECIDSVFDALRDGPVVHCIECNLGETKALGRVREHDELRHMSDGDSIAVLHMHDRCADFRRARLAPPAERVDSFGPNLRPGRPDVAHIEGATCYECGCAECAALEAHLNEFLGTDGA